MWGLEQGSLQKNWPVQVAAWTCRRRPPPHSMHDSGGAPQVASPAGLRFNFCRSGSPKLPFPTSRRAVSREGVSPIAALVVRPHPPAGFRRSAGGP